MPVQLYEKVGRRYVPVQIDPWCYEVSDGFYLVHRTRYSVRMERIVEPALAEVYAASFIAREAMLDAMRQESAMRPEPNGPRPLTAREKRAHAAYCEVMGAESMIRLSQASAHQIVEAGLRALEAAVAASRAEPAIANTDDKRYSISAEQPEERQP